MTLTKESDAYEIREILVDPGQMPYRIDRYLFEKMEGLSRSKIQKAISDKLVEVNNKIIKSNYKIQPQDRIHLKIPKQYTQKTELLPEDIPLDIRYEDEDVIVLHKPPGLVVHPGIGNKSGTLVNALAYHLKRTDLPVMPGNDKERAGLVHRIDKDTSGLMVVAKNESAMTALAKQFHDHTVERTYYALVWGDPEPTAGRIEGNIGRHPKDRIKRYVYPENEGGKHAVTHYEVVESFYYVSVVKCNLETGRTHQIRVHMSSVGHPLFNDRLYDGDRVRKGTVFSKYKTFVENNFKRLPRHALHAKTLGFVHPKTKEKMTFDSDMPEDINLVIERWRDYCTHQRTKKK